MICCAGLANIWSMFHPRPWLPQPISPIVIRSLGAVFPSNPRADEGTIAGNPDRPRPHDRRARAETLGDERTTIQPAGHGVLLRFAETAYGRGHSVYHTSGRRATAGRAPPGATFGVRRFIAAFRRGRVPSHKGRTRQRPLPGKSGDESPHSKMVGLAPLGPPYALCGQPASPGDGEERKDARAGKKQHGGGRLGHGQHDAGRAVGELRVEREVAEVVDLWKAADFG